MLKAGRIQTLTVSRVSEYGLYLADEEQNEVLLPNRYTSLTDKVGDRKEVFLYHDSEDRLVATTETPLLREGEAGYLRVVDKTAHGAFLDWGLHGKDLFLPNRNQQGGILAGHSYIVYLYEDNITGRCVATTKLKSFINNDLITVKPREEVSLLVASESEIGFRVIVNNRHWGMIYRNQIFRPVAVGDRLKGYVRRITEDNRIDVSLQQTGFAQVKDSAEVLLQLVRDNGGFLPLNDDSAPEEVTRLTGTSKKVFKRSLGMLLKLDRPNVEFRQAVVPPLDFPDRSFDCVISFQVIEHIKRDAEFVREIHRVLRPGGRFIVTTPNAPMSLTRNPWHVREYTAEQLRRLLAARFSEIETLGVFGNEKVMDYYAENRRGVERITRFDILDLQHRLPRWMLQIPYDILNRMNRRKLLRENTGLTTSIRMDDYRIEPVGDGCFDLFYIAVK